MTDWVPIISGLTTLVRSIAETSDEVKRNRQLNEFLTALIGFQSQIASIQAENASLIKQLEDAKNEAVRLKNFEADKERYALKQTEPGVIVQALKESMSHGQPPHYLCANCHANGDKSFLQTFVDKSHRWGLECSKCHAKMQGEMHGPSRPKYA